MLLFLMQQKETLYCVFKVFSECVEGNNTCVLLLYIYVYQCKTNLTYVDPSTRDSLDSMGVFV